MSSDTWQDTVYHLQPTTLSYAVEAVLRGHRALCVCVCVCVGMLLLTYYNSTAN